MKRAKCINCGAMIELNSDNLILFLFLGWNCIFSIQINSAEKVGR